MSGAGNILMDGGSFSLLVLGRPDLTCDATSSPCIAMAFIQVPTFSILHCSPFMATVLVIFDIRLLLSSRIFNLSCARRLTVRLGQYRRSSIINTYLQLMHWYRQSEEWLHKENQDRNALK